jgi:hypothetical protein
VVLASRWSSTRLILELLLPVLHSTPCAPERQSCAHERGRSRRVQLTAVVALTIAFSGATAFADPIRVTSGFVEFRFPSSLAQMAFDFIGSDFHFAGRAFAGEDDVPEFAVDLHRLGKSFQESRWTSRRVCS